MPGVAALTAAQVREALRALGHPEHAEAVRATRNRRLQEALRSYGTVRTLLDQAPEAASTAFTRLVEDGPAPVEDVLGRGWWGRGALPPPLDWLQVRGLVAVTDDGLLHAVDEAREGFLQLTLDVTADVETQAQPLSVQAAGSVVVAPTAAALDRAVAVRAARLRAVTATVAISPRSPETVAVALRSAGIALDGDVAVAASESEPALPGTVEEAVGPRAIRALLGRAVTESRQLRLEYYTSSRAGAKTERVVDPWSFRDDLLVGYCHLRDGERSFAVDRIGRARLLPSAIQHAPAGQQS